MSQQLHNELKKEFQLERLILFSDAVFAIVITLMAIEIRLPQTDQTITSDQLNDMLRHLVPVFFSYAVSFIFLTLSLNRPALQMLYGPA